MSPKITCKCGMVHRGAIPVGFQCPTCSQVIEATNVSAKSIQGLGDAIYAVTTFLHIPHCQSCEERRQYLNEKFPF